MDPLYKSGKFTPVMSTVACIVVSLGERLSYLPQIHGLIATVATQRFERRVDMLSKYFVAAPCWCLFCRFQSDAGHTYPAHAWIRCSRHGRADRKCVGQGVARLLQLLAGAEKRRLCAHRLPPRNTGALMPSTVLGYRSCRVRPCSMRIRCSATRCTPSHYFIQ